MHISIKQLYFKILPLLFAFFSTSSLCNSCNKFFLSFSFKLLTKVWASSALSKFGTSSGLRYRDVWQAQIERFLWNVVTSSSPNRWWGLTWPRACKNTSSLHRTLGPFLLSLGLKQKFVLLGTHELLRSWVPQIKCLSNLRIFMWLPQHIAAELRLHTQMS